MDSFYGGKRGFSFILRPNPDDENGYWSTLGQIEAAIADKKINYGEYAIITAPLASSQDSQGSNENEEESPTPERTRHGNLYRVTHNNQAELVGRIGNPALLYSLALDDEAIDNSNEIMTFEYSDDTTLEGLKVACRETEIDGETVFGIGFKLSRPNFNVTNNIINVDDVNTNIGLSIAPVNNTHAANYTVNNYIPPTTIIATKEKIELANLDNIRENDLWLDISSVPKNIIQNDMDTIGIKNVFNTNSLYTGDENNQYTIQNYYRTTSFEVYDKYESLAWSNSPPSFLYVPLLSANDIAIKQVRISLSFQDLPEESNPFNHFYIELKQPSGSTSYFLSGCVNEWIDFFPLAIEHSGTRINSLEEGDYYIKQIVFYDDGDSDNFRNRHDGLMGFLERNYNSLVLQEATISWSFE